MRYRLTACLALALFSSACASTPADKAAKAMRLGKEAVQKKDYSRATIEFKIAARSLPKDPEPLYQLALAYLEIGDVNTAVKALQVALTIDPQHTPSQLKMAELMALHSDPAVIREAEQRARAVMAASQGNSEAVTTLALAEMRLGETASAEEHLKAALSQFPKELAPAVLMATLRLQNKDSDGAEAVLKQLVDKLPKSTDALLAMERLYVSISKLTEAQVYVQRCLQVDPRNSAALMDLASIQAAQGQKAQAEQTYLKVSQLGDKQYRAVHAIFLFQDGRREDAINELNKLWRKDVEDRTLRSQLVSAYLASRRSSDAEQVLNAALKKNPKDVDALLQRAQIYLISNQPAPAEADLNRVLQFRPDSAEAHYFLARTHQLQGAAMNQRHELSRALELDPNLLIARIDLAGSLIAGGDARAALDLMNATPERQRDDVAAVVQRNWALWGKGDLVEMRKGVAKGLAAANNPELVLQQALLRFKDGDVAGGRKLLEDVLNANPEDLRALDTLARSFVAQNQTDLALDQVKLYAAKRPKSPALQQFLGMAMASTGKFVEARNAFEAAKASDSNYVGADFALAELDLTEGKLDAAGTRLNAVLAGNPDNVDARLLLGMVEEVAGKFDEATTNYRKVLANESRNLFALNNLAYRLANDSNQSDEALKYAQAALEIGPDNPAIQDTIGWAYYRKGLYKNALPYLTSASASGKIPVRLYHLSMLYAQLGDQKRAHQVFDSAFHMNPGMPEAKMAQDLLARTTSTSR
ncbi:MAG: tetratricopeptide repeat protein [Bryobacteraceae bacterium]